LILMAMDAWNNRKTIMDTLNAASAAEVQGVQAIIPQDLKVQPHYRNMLHNDLNLTNLHASASVPTYHVSMGKVEINMPHGTSKEHSIAFLDFMNDTIDRSIHGSSGATPTKPRIGHNVVAGMA